MTNLFSRFSTLCFDAPDNDPTYDYYNCAPMNAVNSTDKTEVYIAVAVGLIVTVAATALIIWLRKKKATSKTKKK